MAIPVGRRLPLVAAPAQGRGLCLCQSCLEEAGGGPPDERTPELFTTLGGTLARQPRGLLWRFLLTGRSLPWPARGSLLSVVKRLEPGLLDWRRASRPTSFLQGLEAMTV
jgi:hypothetical protein